MTQHTPMSPMAHSRRHFTKTRRLFQDEEHRIQAKTFTNWMNSYLCKGEHPLMVLDLMEDILDGKVLLSLLEILTGDKLPEAKGPKDGRPSHIDNISTALDCLKRKGVKLVNINATDIADGKPPIVLGLVWTIILHFHIGGASTAEPTTPTPGNDSSLDDADEKKEEAESERAQVTLEQSLAEWARSILANQGLPFGGFGASWRDGLAFQALIQHVRPDLVDMEHVRQLSVQERLEQAFDIALTELDIPKLLEPDDVDVDEPDRKSIMTYVAHFRNPPSPFRHLGVLHKNQEKEERLTLLESEEIATEMEKIKQTVTILRHQNYDIKEQALRCVESHCLEGVESSLTSVHSEVQQLVQLLHDHLQQRLLQTEGLLEQTSRLAQSYDTREREEDEESGEGVPPSLSHTSSLLAQLKSQLDDVISALDEDVTKCSSSGNGSEVTWSVTHDALLTLLQSTGAPSSAKDSADGADCDVQILLNEINRGLGKLDKEVFTADFFEDSDDRRGIEEAITALAKHFTLEGDFTTRFAAFVEKMISCRKTLMGFNKSFIRQRSLHAYFTEQPMEQETLNLKLFELESELKTEEKKAAWFNMEEAQGIYSSMLQTLAKHLAVLQQIRELLSRTAEMKDPSLLCAASLETKMASLGACLRCGDGVLASLRLKRPTFPPEISADSSEDHPQDADNVSAEQVQEPGQSPSSLAERRALLDNWVTEAQFLILGICEDLDLLQIYHASIDEEQLRSGLNSVQDKIKAIQCLSTGGLIKQEFAEVEFRYGPQLQHFQRSLQTQPPKQGKKEMQPSPHPLQQSDQQQQPSSSTMQEIDESVIQLSEILASSERFLATMKDLGQLLKSVTGETTLVSRYDVHHEKWQALCAGALHVDNKEPDDLHTLISQILFLLLLVSYWLGHIHAGF